jgi:FtsP/CotA-like multicopper oxidase with cupredoxin domain
MTNWQRRFLAALFALDLAMLVYGDRPLSSRESLPLGEPVVGVPEPSPEISRFSRAMPVPPVLQPTSRAGDITTYDLTARKDKTAFFPGTSTETYGYNGSLLGPTIRLRRGERTSVRIENHLDRRTNIHWHGVRLPAAADGAHHDIEPGGNFTSTFSVIQPAATLWYHPHTADSGFQVYWGLAGFLYLDDETSDGLPIPRDYGVNDFPLLVQDKHFFRDGTLSYTMQGPEEATEERILGEEILVNGVINPYLDLPQGTVRLRLLNGSDARRYNFALEDGRTFFLIGSDGGLLPAPAPVTSVELAPAERAEILVDFTGDAIGTRLKLVSRAFPVLLNEVGPFVSPYLVSVSGRRSLLVSPVSMGNAYPVMELRIANRGTPVAVPDRLVAVDTMAETEAQTTRVFDIERVGEETINGLRFDMNRIDVQVPTGATEIWSITNYAPDFSHSFHIHGLQFRVLDRSIRGIGQPLPALEAGWKDTVLAHPGERVRVIARFNDMSGVYMFHCHVILHENRGMMGTFLVTDAPSADNHGHASAR